MGRIIASQFRVFSQLHIRRRISIVKSSLSRSRDTTTISCFQSSLCCADIILRCSIVQWVDLRMSVAVVIWKLRQIQRLFYFSAVLGTHIASILMICNGAICSESGWCASNLNTLLLWSNASVELRFLVVVWWRLLLVVRIHIKLSWVV